MNLKCIIINNRIRALRTAATGIERQWPIAHSVLLRYVACKKMLRLLQCPQKTKAIWPLQQRHASLSDRPAHPPPFISMPISATSPNAARVLPRPAPQGPSAATCAPLGSVAGVAAHAAAHGGHAAVPTHAHRRRLRRGTPG